MAELNTSTWFGSNDTDKTGNTTAIATRSMILLLSLIGNSLTVATFYRNKSLRTPVHYFIADMAISDLLIPVVVLPAMINAGYHGNDYFWSVGGLVGDVLCKLVRLAWDVSVAVSILSMLSIAVDRFHAILFPMKPPLISRKSCCLTVIMIWVVSIAFRGHYFYAYKIVPEGNELLCKFQWHPVSYTKIVEKITWLSLLLLSGVSAVALTLLYSSIIVSLYRQKKNSHMASEFVRRRAEENRKVTSMLVVVVVMFYAVWIPYHMAFWIYYFEPNVTFPALVSWFAKGLPMLYPVINPVIYYVFNGKYRHGFRELLCYGRCCNRKCNGCFSVSVTPQAENNVPNSGYVNDAIEIQDKQ